MAKFDEVMRELARQDSVPQALPVSVPRIFAAIKKQQEAVRRSWNWLAFTTGAAAAAVLFLTVILELSFSASATAMETLTSQYEQDAVYYFVDLGE